MCLLTNQPSAQLPLTNSPSLGVTASASPPSHAPPPPRLPADCELGPDDQQRPGRPDLLHADRPVREAALPVLRGRGVPDGHVRPEHAPTHRVLPRLIPHGPGRRRQGRQGLP